MNSKKNLKRNLLICLLAGSAVMYTLPLHAATSVIGNNTLPTGENSLTHNHTFDRGNLEMTITQSGSNGIIKWDSFDVGGSATVNFRGDAGGYNVLNYVNGANASQIYGTINANNNGNIFIVNPAGVQIGNSAQINVGSLYVSNNEMNDDNFNHFMNNADPNNIINYALQGKSTEAALMSLGNINANHVTFEGDGRIVIDSERLKDVAGDNKLTAKNIIVNTNEENNLVIGYDGYDENNNKYNTASNTNIATVNGKGFAQNKGYMWVEDVKQLQAIDTNLGGNYALRNSIDGTQANNFTSIGSNTAFSGKFDGIDYNIFNLNISGTDNVGLFGKTNGATINNVTLVGGSITGTDSNVGAIVGNANNTTLTNVVNSAAVSGNSNVGGIVGSATNTTVEDAINTGAIEGRVNTGGNGGINVGGLIGNMNSSHLIGNSYNLGDVSGDGYNVGGLVGHAVNSTIGDGTNLVYNRLDVTGKYNVGGIVGNMEGTTVQNAENSGNVTASGYDKGKYIFHTDYNVAGYSDNGIKTVDVNVANVGGIAGKADDTVDKVSEIKNVTNSGNVSSNKQDNNDYYDAGNVGGIVGSAVDTNISNATNKENEVRGAHNVGGVAGYFSGAGRITGGINDGGDIMATGARYTNNGITAVVTETIRKDYDATNNDGKYVIGNIGGIVGYMEGDYVHIDASGNRGTVHTLDISDGNNISDASEAANVGGIVGKIDRSRKITDKNELGEKYVNAAVSNSYNTGDVRGFTAIGGIAGMMYNGGIAGAYNLGEIRSTRVATGNETPLNMGGIVGDTTEVSNARAFIYDVYNKGKIGDEAFKYKGRHVGGIVGRLSGVVEKAYNTGAIYNGAAVTGGIAGYLSAGKIENVFNTGNITVENNDGEDLGTQLGGLVGAANIGRGNVNISNAYNLGVIRSFNGDKTQHNVGGIVGYLVNYTSGIQGENAGNLTIKNVYTTGYLYSEGGETTVGVLYGGRRDNVTNPIIQNAVYITPSNNAFTEVADRNLQGATKVTGIYGSSEAATNVWNNFIQQSNVNNEGQTLDLWRVYDGTTPILNAFMPNSKDYFGNEGDYSAGSENSINTGIDKIQYGTAYNPLLTIINANKDLVYDWEKLGINNDAGLAVYGYGVTLNNFRATGGTGYFGGTIYADGALNLKGSSDIGLGSASQIYGSDVTIGTNGKVTIYGDVTATGNKKDNNDTTGSISINAGEVDVYGALTSAKKDQQIQISGIAGSVNPDFNFENIIDKTKPVTNVGDRFAHEVTASETGNITINAGQNATGNGNVNLYYGNKQEGLITTGGDLTVTGTGDVYVDSDLDIGGDVTLEGTGADSEVVLDITNIGQVRGEEYISRLEDAVRGIELTNSNRENIINAILEAGITNDQQEAGRLAARLINSSFEDFGDEKSLEYFHEFMHHFSKVGFGDGTQAGNATITLNAGQSGNTKLTIDMWNDVTETYDLTKYDEKNTASSNNHTLLNELNNLNIVASTLDTDGGVENTDKAQKVTYIWVSSGEQLKGIQTYYDAHKKDEGGTGILSYNFALKGDINASDVEDYVAIGTGSNKDASGNEIGFTGTFDGRGNRIIGLNVSGDDAGIFSTVGTNTVNNNDGTTTTYTGTVKNLNVYSGTFTGTTTAGAVAGVNSGRIEGIVTFGNTVTATGDNGNASTSNAGGIVGVNNSGTFENNANDGELTGGIYDVESTGSVIAGSSTAVAGGLVGTNNGGLANSFSDSAVTVKVDNQNPVTTTGGLGGVVGVNTEKGNVQYVDSLGVTNGGATGSSNIGGIIGTNNGNMYSGYNESIVSGNDNVGGIIGTNSSEVENVVNATSVTGENKTAAQGDDGISEYVGGLVGSNSGSVTNGRNNGTITGTKYVGGMVGSNAQGATLTNITNDSSAAIEGEQYVGGIAGSNAGKISATDDTLINRGSITGNKFVGGVAGVNEDGGTIENTISNIELNVKTPYTNDGNSDNDPAFFGGVVGQNSGTIIGATNQSSVDVAADGATYVGGIIGQNTSTGTLEGKIRNGGTVSGLSNVGGIIGENKNANLLNNDDNNERLEITNTGSVRATQGGAAGIFYSNNISGTEGDTNANAINNVDITNSGTVTGGTDENSVTGGLFGINSGNITNSTLTNTGVVIGGGTVGGLIGTNSGSAKDSTFTNSGTVSGNTNVGGLFGTNSGKFERSSLINTVNGQVIGTNNVGGLIGYNTGEIIGGRKDVNGTDVGYYKYKIYNNGVITIKGNGSNIGGLIGNNTTENGKTGSLTAGYNTGAINASGSTNVGGIAGSNAGIIGEVFNTVMTADGQNQTITGGTNVGGLVGNNSGTLSNAYNTTEVKGNANVGTIIGNNATNNVSNVYNTWDTENSKLISTGNSADNAYNIDSNKQTDYSGLDFNDTWKIYEGNSNPLLKVFLTNLTIKDINNEGTSLKEFLNLVYNGKEQDLNIKALIDNGFIVVPDEEALKAYHNTLIGNNLGESYLINNTDGQKTAGKHNNWLYSEQIHVNTSGEFNPNNLGYDITFANNDKGILEIDKAKLTITLDDIYRIYGQDGLKDGYEYGFSIDGLADSDKNLANDIIIEEGTIEDGALVDINNDGKVTNDVNDIDNPYKWTADVTLSDYIEQNYNILYDGGNSHVTKADLTITADNKETMPGVMPDFTGTDIQQGLVNGDSAGTYDYNLDGSVNIDVDGTYTDKIGISFDNGETYYDLENVDWSTIPGWDFLKNYDINFKPGTLIVSSELLPDIPSDWPHNRWDYLFNDAPFDRTKDFRERKAEVNFVDGGMEI